MAEHADLEAGGMDGYPGCNTVNKWTDDIFANFDTVIKSATDYGKTATDFINANLMKG